MGYIALYRKYRPVTFDSIVGQESITRILKNQVRNAKISHAYLFSGSRGTGKTSAAKILARAINCQHPKDGEPCNECDACISILKGDTTDVMEMDAASNNSVENIRQIRNEVAYVSTSVLYRVYIIDEVHMLTTSAFNALLKTLEEPPENVIFILATTEQHKIPVTILSRCLRFDFLKISEKDIKQRLQFVLEQEKVEYESEALDYIAKLADGAMRDALSILERCLSENSKKVTLKDIKQIIGAIDATIVDALANALLQKDAIAIVSNVDEVVNKGKDLRALIEELTEYFLHLLVKETSSNKQELSNIITQLSTLDNAIRLSMRPATLLKSCFIRISHGNVSTNIVNESSVDNSQLEKRVVNLENRLIHEQEETVTSKPVVEKKVLSVAVGEGLEKFKGYEEFKKNVATAGNLKLFSVLASTDMYLSKEKIVFVTSNEFAYKMLGSETEQLKNMVREKLALDIPIVIELKTHKIENKMEKLLNNNNIQYTNLDERKGE